MAERESINVLNECIELQTKKSNDYQNAKSSIRQADYYPNGVTTILDIMHAKMLRLRSVTEAMQNDNAYNPNFESIEDSAKDLINYASFLVAYTRHKVDGQNPHADIFNKIKQAEVTKDNIAVKLPEFPTHEYARPAPVKYSGGTSVKYR